MDVKSVFLNGFVNDKVYVEQPKGFVDAKFPNHVCKLHKPLYGLKQAHRAWYERLADYLTRNGYTQEVSDKTLIIKKSGTI